MTVEIDKILAGPFDPARVVQMQRELGPDGSRDVTLWAETALRQAGR